jgi:hypothetical protein
MLKSSLNVALPLNFISSDASNKFVCVRVWVRLNICVCLSFVLSGRLRLLNHCVCVIAPISLWMQRNMFSCEVK